MHFTSAKLSPYILLLLKHKKVFSSQGDFLNVQCINFFLECTASLVESEPILAPTNSINDGFHFLLSQVSVLKVLQLLQQPL